MRTSAPAYRYQPLVRCVLYAVLGLVLLFLILPVSVIVPISFTDSTLLVFPPPGWSVSWYEAFFTDPAWLVPLKNSNGRRTDSTDTEAT